MVYYGDDCLETERYAREQAEKKKQLFISPYNDPQVIGGQGTIRAISLLPNNMHENVLEDETNSTKTKAEISFTIPKGSYATELLREIMKT